MLVLLLVMILVGRLAAQEHPASLQNDRSTQQDLDAYVEQAITGNPALRAHHLRYEAAKAQVPQATALPDTKVGFGYFAVPVETRLGPQEATLSVSQSFPWFGTLGAEEDAALARARKHFQEYSDARNRLIVDVRDTYYRMYVLDRSIFLTAEHLRLVQTLRALAAIRYETGMVPFSHLLRLDMEQEELQTRQGYLEDSREPLTAEFSQLLSREVVMTDVRLPDSLALPVESGAIAALEDAVAERNPRLLMLKEETAYWEAKSESARKMGYPSFTVGLTYTAIGKRSDLDVPDNGRDAIIPQVGVSFPLFGSRYGAMEQQAQLQREAARAALENLRNQLSTTLQQKLRDLRDAQRRFSLANSLVDLSGKTYNVLLQEYSAGTTGLDDVLAVERDLLRHALNREQARADCNRAADYLMYLTAQE
jgi:outer membrane protein TolC